MELDITGLTDPTSKSNITEDLLRFSKLHLWYKHLPFEGKEFLLFPLTGQQPKNFFDLQVSDPYGLHWWVWYADFIDEIPLYGRGKEIVMQHSVNFNCFLRGLEDDGAGLRDDGKERGSTYFRGWYLIKRKNPKMEKVLRKRYPNAKGNTDVFAAMEHAHQLERAKVAAEKIYKLIEKECPQLLKVGHRLSTTREFNNPQIDNECSLHSSSPIISKMTSIEEHGLPNPCSVCSHISAVKERLSSDSHRDDPPSARKIWDFSIFHSSTSPRDYSPIITKRSESSPRSSPAYSPISTSKRSSNSPIKGPLFRRKKSVPVSRRGSPIFTRSSLSPREESSLKHEKASVVSPRKEKSFSLSPPLKLKKNKK
jgi:hypothetical protein